MKRNPAIDEPKIIEWLKEVDEKKLLKLWTLADKMRKKYVGAEVLLRGIVEISNHCDRECTYCGINSNNRYLKRYRMSKKDILKCAQEISAAKFGTIIIQSGEDSKIDSKWISDLIGLIKAKNNLAVTLALGERTLKELEMWKDSGADRYLLKFETSKENLYSKIHPPKKTQTWKNRLEILRCLKALGYEIGSGVMVGIPGQTFEDLAGDLLLFHKLDLDMIGSGPYLPHPKTELGKIFANMIASPEQVPATAIMTYKTIALSRILCPKANIPATTALVTIDPKSGFELGLTRGANVVMQNFTPMRYRELYDIYPARACSNFRDFIDDDRFIKLLDETKEDSVRTKEIIAKAVDLNPLSIEETAALMASRSPELTAEIFEGAKKIKQLVYGNRIVIFAPLYIGNHCLNECAYCAFKRTNTSAIRRTLEKEEIIEQVGFLEKKGHKRLVLVFGEHPQYNAHAIADVVKTIYSAKQDHGGEIRRVNINAAPLDVAGFRKLKEAGIGTYQIFQETYHHKTYRHMHPPNTPKGDYINRLHALNSAFRAGIDDVGIGALFGLFDWRFEVLSLVCHSRHLMREFGIGPHTISFPRIQKASGVSISSKWMVDDNDFKLAVAILRLSVPYTGLILTARENPSLRRCVMALGVSQIDAGSRIELGGYTNFDSTQSLEREQFMLGDTRSLDEIVRELIDDGYIPSFCTTCYRTGRTGERFMKHATSGDINKFCNPNAIETLKEYLEHYASPNTRSAGKNLISQWTKKV